MEETAATPEAEAVDPRSRRERLFDGLKAGAGLSRYFGRSLATVFRIAPMRSLVSMAGAVLTSLLPFTQAWLYKTSINRLTTFPYRGHHPSFHQMYPVIWPFVAATMMIVAQRVVNMYLQRNTQWLQNDLETSLELRLVEHVVLLDLQTQENSEFRNKLNRADRSASTFMQTLGWVNSMGSALITLVIATYLVVQLNPVLIALFVGVSLPGFVIAVRQSRLFDKLWEHGVEYAMTHIFTNYLMRPETNTEIRVNNAHGHLARTANKYRVSWRDRRRKVQLRVALWDLAADTIETALQLGVEIWLVMRMLTFQSFSFGSLMFYTSIIDQFSGAISTLFGEVSDFYGLAIDLRAFHEVMDTESKITSPPDARRIPRGHVPHIEFRGVGFKYESKEEPTMRGVNLVIRPGERIAIVGVNGAGKSTFIKLLLRLYDPTEGAILVDGHDLREYSVEDWHRTMSVLLQDYLTYPASARENVELGEISGAGDARRVDSALDRSEARPVVTALKQGLDTKMSRYFQDGEWLSGGQRQRLALARAAYRRDAGVMVLDEPTAAVDAVAEEKIFRALFDNDQRATLFVISHRFSTVRRADRVIVLGSGQVQEDGTHDELMAIEGGIYRGLFEAQAANLMSSPVPVAA